MRRPPRPRGVGERRRGRLGRGWHRAGAGAGTGRRRGPARAWPAQDERGPAAGSSCGSRAGLAPGVGCRPEAAASPPGLRGRVRGSAVRGSRTARPRVGFERGRGCGVILPRSPRGAVGEGFLQVRGAQAGVEGCSLGCAGFSRSRTAFRGSRLSHDAFNSAFLPPPLGLCTGNPQPFSPNQTGKTTCIVGVSLKAPGASKQANFGKL